jgi:hypothetical protein
MKKKTLENEKHELTIIFRGKDELDELTAFRIHCYASGSDYTKMIKRLIRDYNERKIAE